MTIDELRRQVPSALGPGDRGWDRARLFHSGIGEPEAIVRPESVAEVQAAVRWAAASGIAIMVRGGGHSAWGGVPGGLTIDLAALTTVDVDAPRVRVGGGAVWGQVARELSAHGLGISSGDTASVGVGGLTLGGGIGWMVRAWGLAADQLEGAQMVTADGDIVEVSSASHPDLLWGLRGGGGNFGVVTRFDFRAHELPGVVFATLGIGGDANTVIRAIRDALVAAPRELTVTYMDVPPMDPSAPAGASITACWIGRDVAAARAALAPLLSTPGVTETDVRQRDYPDILLETPAIDPKHPMPGFIGGNALFDELTDDMIERLVAFRTARPAAVLFLRSLGGAYGDVAPDATAFARRGASWFGMAGAFDIPGVLDEAGRITAETEWAAIERLGSGAYGNFATSTGPEWVSKMYPPATLARLTELKRAWDRRNLFSRNHNVAPR
jgi:hypothetical protein